MATPGSHHPYELPPEGDGESADPCIDSHPYSLDEAIRVGTDPQERPVVCGAEHQSDASPSFLLIQSIELPVCLEDGTPQNATRPFSRSVMPSEPRPLGRRPDGVLVGTWYPDPNSEEAEGRPVYASLDQNGLLECLRQTSRSPTPVGWIHFDPVADLCDGSDSQEDKQRRERWVREQLGVKRRQTRKAGARRTATTKRKRHSERLSAAKKSKEGRQRSSQ